MKLQDLFESYDPTKDKPLAKATDKDGYRIEIHSHVDKPLPDHHKGVNNMGYEIDRHGTMYIFAPNGKWVHAGYWMNWPEKEWKIPKRKWYQMPLQKRAQLEANWQTHAYNSLKSQFENR